MFNDGAYRPGSELVAEPHTIKIPLSKSRLSDPG